MEVRKPDYSIFPERQVSYASFWERLVACLVDAFILNLSAWLFLYLIPFTPSSALVGPAFGLLANWLYSALQESSTAQATIGKRFMNIKVTNINGWPSFIRTGYRQAFRWIHIGCHTDDRLSDDAVGRPQPDLAR